jgi:endoglucanase
VSHLAVTQGHFQIIFNMRKCPLWQQRLPIFDRFFYCSGVWSYIVCALTTPVFMVVPIVTIWLGVFPMIINWWAALAITVNTVATLCVQYYFRRLR